MFAVGLLQLVYGAADLVDLAVVFWGEGGVEDHQPDVAENGGDLGEGQRGAGVGGVGGV